MNKVFLEKMKQNLLAQKNMILSRGQQNLDVDNDGDETDEIQANMLIEINNHLGSRDIDRLKDIDIALIKMKDSSYGCCDDCGEDIPEKRLSINPCFLTCIGCAEEREIQAKNNKRS